MSLSAIYVAVGRSKSARKQKTANSVWLRMHRNVPAVWNPRRVEAVIMRELNWANRSKAALIEEGLPPLHFLQHHSMTANARSQQ